MLGNGVKSVPGVARCPVQVPKVTVKRRMATLGVRLPAAGAVTLSGKGARRVRKVWVGVQGRGRVVEGGRRGSGAESASAPWAPLSHWSSGVRRVRWWILGAIATKT